MADADNNNTNAPTNGTLPQIPADAIIVVPVKNLVLFPNTVVPITIGRPKSIAAAQQALREQKQIGVLMQRDDGVADPSGIDMHRVGTIANIVRYVTAPDGTHHVVCQGEKRFQVVEFLGGWPFLVARIRAVEAEGPKTPDIEARFLNLRRQTQEALELLPQVPAELVTAAQSMQTPSDLADFSAAYMDIKPDEKQEILETIDVAARMDRVSRLLAQRIEVLRLSNEIGEQTKAALDQRQREVLLREQMAAIQKQLGEGDEGKAAEIAELKEQIAKAKMPKEVDDQARKEVRRLERMSDASAEYGMIRTYIDWLIELPWSLPEEAPIDVAEARKILDADHFGLDKIKRRIVEYLAVRKLAPQGKAPILCFVGPPGVGKTSLGQSIAKAMQRKFVRVSLGGVHDEAEIRGHRRTYIGALPGNIVQALRKAGSRNCVMMLDEIDKLGSGIQGDPSAALLEVLDPEQNGTFRDAYLGVPFDLSRVVFIATANMLDTIPGPLRDRMEIISLAGYTASRKVRDREALPGAAAARGQRLARRQGRAHRRRAARHHPALHARSRRALARARDRQGAAPCGGPDRRRRGGPDPHRGCRPANHSRRAALRGRGRDARQHARRRHRSRVDAGRRRYSLHRGDAGARQGPVDADRPAWRRHEGERTGGADGRQGARSRPAGRFRTCSRRATCICTFRPVRSRRTARAPASPCSWRSPR